MNFKFNIRFLGTIYKKKEKQKTWKKRKKSALKTDMIARQWYVRYVCTK